MKTTLMGLKTLIKKDYKRIGALAAVLLVASVTPVFGEPENLFIKNEALQQAVTFMADSALTPKKETVTIKTTAYSASADQTDSTPEIMASGKRVYVGAIACPRRFPFGTKVDIGGKTYICEDRMALKFDNSFGTSKDERFDILMASRSEAIRHGVKKVEATIIYGA